MINFMIGSAAVTVIAFFALRAYLEITERIENKHREKMRENPLTWNRENGFNRPPTLDEARQFTPDEEGDKLRERIALGESLDMR